MQINQEINVSELRSLTIMMLDHLEAVSAGKPIVVLAGQDYYWDVGWPDVHDAMRDPSKLGLGSLSDDLECLRSMRKGHKATLGLTYVASLLRYAAHQIPA